MSYRPLRLEEAPGFVIQFPLCGACEVDLEHESGVGWRCPSCWTTWSDHAGDGDAGELTDYPFDEAYLICPNNRAYCYANLSYIKREKYLRRELLGETDD